MTFEYTPNLSDLAETHMRLRRRSPFFRRDRLNAAVNLAALLSGMLYIGSAEANWEYRWWLAGGGALLGFFGMIFTYEATYKQNLLKRIRREIEPLLPIRTRFMLDASRLRCGTRRLELAFLLADFQGAQLDDEYLELSFGPVGLCVIPQRAFESDSYRDEFLTALERGRHTVEATNQ